MLYLSQGLQPFLSFLLAFQLSLYLMAQVGSVKPVGATDDITQSIREPPTCQISQPKEDATKFLEQVHQRNSNLADRSIPEPDVIDDDVQLVLSVPRRRKKKRKRFTFSHSPLGQYQETQCFLNEPKEDTKSIDCSSRRKSTSVVQRLESCHLGEKEAGQRRGSLPAVPMSINTPIQQLSWTHESNYNHHQFPAFANPVPWWEEPSTALPHAPLPTSNWVPWQQEDAAIKKRKFEDCWQDNVPRKQYRQSTQISPRSNPVSMAGSRFNSQLPNAGMAGTLDRHMSDHATNMTWPSFDWEPYRIVNPQYVSPYTQSSMTMDMTDSNHGSMSQHQPSFQDWSQHTSMFSHEFDHSQRDCDMFSPSHSPIPQPIASPARYLLQQCSSSSPLQQPLSVLRSQPPQPSTPSSNSTMEASKPHVEVNTAATSSNKTPTPATLAASQLHVRAPASSDVLRRPSLYKIPAWPPTPSVPAHNSSPASPVVPPATDNPNSITPDVDRRTTLHVTANSMTAQQLPNGAQNVRLTTNAGSTPCVNDPISPSSSSPTPRDKSPMTRSAEEFQIPRARAGRKHSPNIIVDIAETCQEVFPFAAVAERHGIPLQKVFDTFSAIIQLPLLRNADDRRRHGSLGKRRIKEYRDARKAMERAQEAERKAEMRAMRARVDEAAKKSQGQGPASGNMNANVNGKGLLKAAILNSAGKTQGVGTA